MSVVCHRLVLSKLLPASIFSTQYPRVLKPIKQPVEPFVLEPTVSA